MEKDLKTYTHTHTHTHTHTYIYISIKLSHCFTPEILKINDITMKKDVVHPIIDGKKDRTLQNTFRFNLQLYNFSWERKKKRATVPFSPVPTKI